MKDRSTCPRQPLPRHIHAHFDRPGPHSTPPPPHLLTPQDLCEGGEYQCVMSNLLTAWDTDMGLPSWSTANLATPKTKTTFPLTSLQTRYPNQKGQEQLKSMLGNPVFDGSTGSDDVTSADAVKVRARERGEWRRGEGKGGGAEGSGSGSGPRRGSGPGPGSVVKSKRG